MLNVLVEMGFSDVKPYTGMKKVLGKYLFAPELVPQYAQGRLNKSIIRFLRDCQKASMR